MDLQEGKDHPQHLGEKPYDKNGSLIGTLLHLTKPVWGTGKLVLLDSGFCVLQDLVEVTGQINFFVLAGGYCGECAECRGVFLWIAKG